MTSSGSEADALFARLVEAQAGMDAAGSLRFYARLVLLLRHQLGDDAMVIGAIEVARSGIDVSGELSI